MDSSEAAASVAKSIEATEKAHGLPPITKLLVAIHGIGSQTRGDTIRSVARQFGDRENLPVMPLGFFHIEGVGKASFSRIDAPPGTATREIGFLEVYWADIPRRVATAEDVLEESKAWGRTVVSRAQSSYRTVKNPQLEDADFQVGIGVVEEIVEAIGVLENLLFLAEKAGFFKFDLARLLRDYVGDVQVVAEFAYLREEIVFRFHKGMADVVASFGKKSPPEPVPKIYVVAHSEGTVVSFLAMLQALAVKEVPDPTQSGGPAVKTDWISHIHGFMTIGSPIDKHLLLWPTLWEDFELENSRLDAPIKWRNYYDLGDPVGFRLDTAREFLTEKKCTAFEFESTHDYGFSRYILPGKAHVDYWGDSKVFGHFIEDVVLPASAEKRPVDPPNKPLAGFISLAFPYLLAFLLHVGAVYVLHKGIIAFLGLHPEPRDVVREVLSLSALLAGITVSARISRLTKTNFWSWKFRWRFVAIAAFVAGAVSCYFGLTDAAKCFIGQAFEGSDKLCSESDATLGRLILIAAAAVLSASGWIIPRRARLGRRLLVFGGFIVAASIVILQALHKDHMNAPFWPTLLAGAGFIYLWWLGILIFDLTFIWHRYIRESAAVKTLDDWSCGWEARPNGWMGFGSPAAAPSEKPPRWKKKQK